MYPSSRYKLAESKEMRGCMIYYKLNINLPLTYLDGDYDSLFEKYLRGLYGRTVGFVTD